MDLMALAYAVMLALGGVAVDAYQNPNPSLAFFPPYTVTTTENP